MTRVLAVDDDPVSLLVLTDTLTGAGYRVDQAGDGEEAWDKMAAGSYDLVLLDKMMPRLDGLGLLRRMKADPGFAAIPVILQTVADGPDDIREGLEAGAYYYLSKPVSPEVLRVLAGGVLADVAECHRMRDAKANLTTTLMALEKGEFTFRTLDEVRALAAGLAQLCHQPDDVGMGLLELMINAVEHGNLGITYLEKTALRKAWLWDKEILRRLDLPPWSERVARIGVTRRDATVEFQITDQGDGFDWRNYLEVDPRRAFDVHGRGIAMAKAISFSRLEYRGNGNTVVVQATARSRQD